MAKTGPSALTDAQLVQGVLHGKDDWYEAVYLRYEPELLSLAWRITRDSYDARVVVLETMEAVCEHLAGFDPATASFRTWVHRICANRARDCVRARSRRARRSCSLDALPETREPTGSGPAEEYARRELGARVRAAVDRLPPAQREVVRLFWFAGYSQDEIAGRLGRTPAGVRHALVRARARLRQELAGLAAETFGPR
ncbi:sigma-70 family RNA polymerase sigma factor [candidate division WOR-3 bacterium]|nr:sigma-70 family RNA polymerase sigma factor [candidate division WOR-3 bacterium]